ncbi:MAG: hypothetical protein LBR38_05185 [Synergistaceae bacterium]|jgi:lysine-ketoglutarate reductase/saccharopine dehydrogenase-like protein (TIGR00300 family)|nr:hypothetical protein [Synergistaceae bacterium]
MFPIYNEPSFSGAPFNSSPDAAVAPVEMDGVAPKGFHATSVFPEYFKIGGQVKKWVLLEESRMDCVVVVRGEAKLEAVEFRRLKRDDLVVLGRTEDGSQGIFVHDDAFSMEEDEAATLAAGNLFSFRSGRSRETAFSRDYDRLYELLRLEKRCGGTVVWVMGPAVAFDRDSRDAMTGLIRKGYVHALLAGNALATHDLEAALMGTALGQDIYTQENRPNGHYNHLDLINTARRCGSLPALINGELAPQGEGVSDGIVHAVVEMGIPMVLAGSIRDDGPLPGVYADVYEAQDAMRDITRRATTVIAMATQLHTIAVGNMTPSYTVRDGKVRPVYFYSVDVSEFAVNKLHDRGTLLSTSIVANVQDFLVHLNKNLD